MGSIGRRELLSGLGIGLGTMAARGPLAPVRAALETAECRTPSASQALNLSVSFAADGLIGENPSDHLYVEQLLKATIVPPLSDVFIYAHGWLTNAIQLMMIYNILVQGVVSQLNELRAASAPLLALPTASLVLTTHWPSRSEGGSIKIRDLTSYSTMEKRANLVGVTGMARLIGSVWECLLASPQLASTRLHLIGHSFGSRILCSALQAVATQALHFFAELQTRNLINLILLQPAFPNDALEPNDLIHAHPFAQLLNYQNLRILATRSRWDIPLVRFYPVREGQQPSDLIYALEPAGTRNEVPALGGVGPTDATWRAFNGDLRRTEVSVGPGFRYAEVIAQHEQRLVIADLTPLHAAHRQEDVERPPDQLPPFGRPDKRFREV